MPIGAVGGSDRYWPVSRAYLVIGATGWGVRCRDSSSVQLKAQGNDRFMARELVRRRFRTVSDTAGALHGWLLGVGDEWVTFLVGVSIGTR